MTKSKVNKAYKYRLVLDAAQKKELDRRFAIQRKAWNFMLEKWRAFNESEKNGGLKISDSDRYKIIRSLYKNHLQLPENDWQMLRNRRYYDYLTKDFKAAWKKFWQAAKNGDLKSARKRFRERYQRVKAIQAKQGSVTIKWPQERFDAIFQPKFKSFLDAQSYATDLPKGGAKINLKTGEVWIDKATTRTFRFMIRQKDKIYAETITKITKLTFSKTGSGAYYLSISLECLQEDKAIRKVKNSVGVDLGCKTWAVLSNGERIERSNTKKIDARIQFLQQKLSKSWEANHQKAGWDKKNWQRLKRQIAKLQERKANIRKQETHQLTHQLTRDYDLIAIEDLKNQPLRGAIQVTADGKTFAGNDKRKRNNINRAMLDKNFFEIKRQFIYKSAWRGKKLYIADAYFASSQICSNCGENEGKKELNIRLWICNNCGATHDRDVNAAKNLVQKALEK